MAYCKYLFNSICDFTKKRALVIKYSLNEYFQYESTSLILFCTLMAHCPARNAV